MGWNDATALAQYGFPASAFAASGSDRIASIGARFGFQPLPEDMMKDRDVKARRLLDSCKARTPEGGGSCLFPRGVHFLRDGRPGDILLPCGVCKVCHERALRAETAICMTEVHVSDWSAFVTLTYADPDEDEALRVEHEADLVDPLLSPYQRAWRVRNRAERAARRVDLAHVHLHVDHIRAFLKRLVAQGRKQGKRDPGAGFRITAWRVGQYGGETLRPHWHLLICGKGALPRSWPRPRGFDKDKHDFVRVLQWPHGHMQVQYGITEGRARYVLRYMLSGIGKPRGVSVEAPHPRWRSDIWNDRQKRWEPRGYFQRPRFGGHEFARSMGLSWAKSGLFPGDFRFFAPGCRDQRPKYRTIGSANAPGGDNRRAVLVHNGRASIMSGSRRRVAIEAYCEALGIEPLALLEKADRRTPFLQESVEKHLRFIADREARRDKFARADFDLDRLRRELDLQRPSEAAARSMARDERDIVDIVQEDDIEALRDLSGAAFRASIRRAAANAPVPVVPVPGPERDAYEAALALAQAGSLVWRDGAWIDVGDPAPLSRAPP